MNFETWFKISHSLIQKPSIEAVLKLAEGGATVPFMARYRKEQTGNLDEVAIQDILDAKESWDALIARQKFILEEIERQGKLSPELKQAIETTFAMQALEDLYLPYKQKRKTKAALAREAGLEPLAQKIWDAGHNGPTLDTSLEGEAALYVNADKGVETVISVLDGVGHLLVERLAETQALRQQVRDRVLKEGYVRAEKGKGAKSPSKFEPYFFYCESIASLNHPEHSHRYLALRRGWMEEELVVSIGSPLDAPSAEHAHDKRKIDALEAVLLDVFEREACTHRDRNVAALLLKSARLALKAYVLPSIEAEVHQALKDVADVAAIHVFAANVRQLLLAAPFGSKAVMGIDPGIRTGCKIAVVDDAGTYLASTVIHLESETARAQARKILCEAVKNAPIRAVAIGNGTAGRETESFVRALFKAEGVDVPVVMVSEAGASIYSASAVARDEFPNLDLTVRGAISIARRLQDPLAELVKVDPKSIGVGQYQHDVSPSALKKSLSAVVESCVNAVGVNLNTASPYLLSHVSGIGPALAKTIVTYRAKQGLFKNRQELLNVSRFSQKIFEQSAGFLRIPDGEYPLDKTGVHPERYACLKALATRLNRRIEDLMGDGVSLIKKDETLRHEVGQFTFEDIILELEKPGRDPRDHFVPFQFRDDIAEIKDLVLGMRCPGIVTNVTNFGAFVDIGVHQDGLVHVSQLADRFVKDPRDVVSPGDRVSVNVISVNIEKRQIALSMRENAHAHHDKQISASQSKPVEKNNRTAVSKKEAHHPSTQKRAAPSGFGHNPFAALATLRETPKS